MTGVHHPAPHQAVVLVVGGNGLIKAQYSEIICTDRCCIMNFGKCDHVKFFSVSIIDTGL